MHNLIFCVSMQSEKSGNAIIQVQNCCKMQQEIMHGEKKENE